MYVGDRTALSLMIWLLGAAMHRPAEPISEWKWSLKALQNTGPQDFRQSYFVDTRYTHGYSSWFLTVTAEFC
jgi:hypothetical protein